MDDKAQFSHARGASTYMTPHDDIGPALIGFDTRLVIGRWDKKARELGVSQLGRPWLGNQKPTSPW